MTDVATAGPVSAGLARPRAPSARADRLLLPHARLAVRGRGRRAGHAAARLARARPLRGPRLAALLAVPHRHQRLPRHAQAASSAARGRWTSARRVRRTARSARSCRRPPGSSPSPTAASCRRGRPGGRRRVAARRIRLAFVAALQHLPPRQRAALILCEVLQLEGRRGRRAARHERRRVNSALQRARATLDAPRSPTPARRRRSTSTTASCSSRYVDAFQRYDMDALTALIHEDATQSMPPYELWLRGREDIFGWWVGPGAGCRGSRVIPTQPPTARPRSPSTSRAGPAGDRVGAAGARISGDRIVELTFFLSTERSSRCSAFRWTTPSWSSPTAEPGTTWVLR